MIKLVLLLVPYGYIILLLLVPYGYIILKIVLLLVPCGYIIFFLLVPYGYITTNIITFIGSLWLSYHTNITFIGSLWLYYNKKRIPKEMTGMLSGELHVGGCQNHGPFPGP